MVIMEKNIEEIGREWLNACLQDNKIWRELCEKERKIKWEAIDETKELSEMCDLLQKQYEQAKKLLESARERISNRHKNILDELKRKYSETQGKRNSSYYKYWSKSENLSFNSQSKNLIVLFIKENKNKYTANEIAHICNVESSYVYVIANQEKLKNYLLHGEPGKESSIPLEIREEIEKILYLQTLDEAWREHLYQMDILKTGIGLRGYNQKDPLVEYKKESYKLFTELIETVKINAVRVLHSFRIGSDTTAEEIEYADEAIDIVPASQKREERLKNYDKKKS
jgi:preprotein translocase subunit SecA